MAKTANQALYEAGLRHHVHLLRFADGQADVAGKALKAAEGDLLEKISGAMAKGLDATRLESLLASVKKLRAEVYSQIGLDATEALQGLTEAEADWETSSLKGASPIQLNMASVPVEQLHAAVASPIAGIPLQGWLDNIQSKEALALQQAVTQAVLQGETIDDLVRRIRGTKAKDFQDGILSASRRNAEALARTAVNHVSNQARSQVWEANADIVRALRWTSTLDGRTSTICQSRDGHLAPNGASGHLLPSEQPLTPPGAQPPAHFNCRSVLIPIMDGVELASDRPFVADARTRAEREKAFRADAKERGVPIQQIRKEWAEKHVGTLPETTTYQDWLKGQPASFQDEVLGKAKADLFRGGLPLERFVDASGKTLSLAELKVELAGDALNVLQPAIGLKAKGLLMQGLEPADVLNAIKSEFPNASTSAASIASYKSELKKAGLLDGSVKPSVNQKYLNLNTAGQVNIFEAALPTGLKNSIQGQWATVVDSLEGHPGAYAHYKPGVGVELSDSKLQGLSKAQAQQVMAHELGHMLNKQHGFDVFTLMDPDINDPFASAKDWAQSLALKAVDLPPELKKLYGYYIHSQDELIGEIIGQAIHPSPVTSQGMSALKFNEHFAEQIANVQKVVKAKFPDVLPMPTTGPVIKGVGEIAGKPTSIGGYAKALLQQGMPDTQVLDAVLAEFPSAKTTMNSIKSYKSELKKVEQAAIGKPGPAIHAKMAPQIDPEAPPSPPAPKGVADPAAEVAKPSADAVPLGGYTKIGGKPGGSNPGAVFKDPLGDEWLVKGNLQKVNGNASASLSDARARNEVLTARLLRIANPGIAPEMKLVDLEGQFGGGLGVASKMIDKPIIKFDPTNLVHVSAARKDFALHAWLGNHDVVGASFDNLVMKAGKAVNIDPGGAILFRAQGLAKDSFGSVADEWVTMRQAGKAPQASKVYGGMSEAELNSSAQQLLKFTDEVIDDAVAAMGPGEPMSNTELAKVLKARRDDILNRAGLKMQKPVVGPTFDEVPAAPVSAAPVTVNFKAMTIDQLAQSVIPADLIIQSWYGSTKASWIIQKAAAELFKTGIKTEVVHDALVAKFGPQWVPKTTSLASMKSKLKKLGLLEGTPAVGDGTNLAAPKLWGKALGSKSSGVKETAKLMMPSKSAKEVIDWIGTQFTSPNPQGAADLYELAFYELKTGKVYAKPGVKAVSKSYGYTPTPSLPAPVPLRPATKVGEAGPPPPRFTKEGRQAGLQKYGGLGSHSSVMDKINKMQKAAGRELLEEEEVAAIKAYTGSAYRRVNELLRTGKFAGDNYLQAWTDAAMHGLHKLPEWTGTVKRGMSVSEAELKQLKMFYRPGAIIEEAQFLSTANAETGGNFGGNILYTMKVKTGRDVKSISSYKGENEILMMPGMKFKVVSITEGSGGYYGGSKTLIELEEV